MTCKFCQCEITERYRHWLACVDCGRKAKNDYQNESRKKNPSTRKPPKRTTPILGRKARVQIEPEKVDTSIPITRLPSACPTLKMYRSMDGYPYAPLSWRGRTMIQ